jgi:hypothetical protein
MFKKKTFYLLIIQKSRFSPLHPSLAAEIRQHFHSIGGFSNISLKHCLRIRACEESFIECPAEIQNNKTILL